MVLLFISSFPKDMLLYIINDYEKRGPINPRREKSRSKTSALAKAFLRLQASAPLPGAGWDID